MLGEGENDTTEAEDDFSDDDAAATIVMDDDSVEINVEELIAKLEDDTDDEVARKKAVRKRLEELNERRAAELDGTFNFNMDEDI